MSVLDLATLVLLAGGGAFFVAGTVGLLRFPDLFCRLHAVTKADNLGLGMIVAGLALQAEGVPVALKLLGIWVLVLTASATACYLVAREALPPRGRRGDEG